MSAVRDQSELRQILDLQRRNLAGSLRADEAVAQGFVTVAHDLTSLEQMHALAPSIIAKSAGDLVGYALTMPVEARACAPILEPMFRTLETLVWRGCSLTTLPYYVMGQVCVAKAYRGQGVFDALYQGHESHYSKRYALLVTEVATRNVRSLRAHERVGFEPIHRYRDDVDEWLIVGWDWQS